MVEATYSYWELLNFNEYSKVYASAFHLQHYVSPTFAMLLQTTDNLPFAKHCAWLKKVR